MDKKKNVRMGMAKAVADAGTVKASTAKKVSDVEWLKPQNKAAAKQSDMWTVYNAVLDRFDAEGVAVNSDTDPNRVEIGCDFVDDCSAMIPARTGTPPEYAPFNFTARVTCVAAKGNETGLRLDILKNTVRAALMNEPLDLETYRVSVYVTDEQDSVVVGFRKSVLTLIMKAEVKKKLRW
jgi:hypothetical protein